MMNIKIKKPLFIVFEGIDGSGKSTQVDLFFKYLEEEAINVVKLFEPTDSSWGRSIRKILKEKNEYFIDELLYLFIKDREYDVEHNILPLVVEEKIILMDRYMYSNAAYQGIGKYSPQKILGMNTACGFPIPDRVYLIDIEPELALQRILKRSGSVELFEKKSSLIKIRENYHKIKSDNFVVIDGALSPRLIFKIIKEDFLENFVLK